MSMPAARPLVILLMVCVGGAARADRCGQSLRRAYCQLLHCESTPDSAACQSVSDEYRKKAGFSVVCDDHALRVFAPFPPEEAFGFDEELARFTAATGVPVAFERANVEQDAERIAECGGDVIFAGQPGMILDLGAEGRAVDLASFADMDRVRQDFSAPLLDIASRNGGLFGVYLWLELKSLIWYPPAQFAARGYHVPETWDQLIALSNQIVADHGTPWCMYFENGPATGWVLTDWIEDIVLRLPNAGPEVYDAWVAHDVLFSDPRIREAFSRLGQILFTPGYLFDAPHVSTISLICNFLPMFGLPSDTFGEDCGAVPPVPSPPGCWLHRQAWWISFFAPGVEDLASFPFPPMDPALPRAQLGAGTAAVLLRDRPEGRALFQYFLGASFGEVMASRGAILANRSVPPEWYEGPDASPYAETVRSSLVDNGFRFDASDMMPFEVGAGSFWSEITRFALGASIEEVTANIDASWP